MSDLQTSVGGLIDSFSDVVVTVASTIAPSFPLVPRLYHKYQSVYRYAKSKIPRVKIVWEEHETDSSDEQDTNCRSRDTVAIAIAIATATNTPAPATNARARAEHDAAAHNLNAQATHKTVHGHAYGNQPPSRNVPPVPAPIQLPARR